MGRHTSGPWEVCTTAANDSWHNGITIGTAEERFSRRICDLAVLSPDNEANGRLIASAPDLLDAVKIARDGFRAAKVEILANAMEEVIAKAEQPTRSGLGDERSS